MKWEIGDKMRILDAAKIDGDGMENGDIYDVINVDGNGLPIIYEAPNVILGFMHSEMPYVERVTDEETEESE